MVEWHDIMTFKTEQALLERNHEYGTSAIAITFVVIVFPHMVLGSHSSQRIWGIVMMINASFIQLACPLNE